MISQITKKELNRMEFQSTLMSQLKFGLQTFLERNNRSFENNSEKETRITILVSPLEFEEKNRQVDVYIYFEELPPPPSSPIYVQVKRWKREVPTLKSSQWVRERKALECGKPNYVNEVILQDPKTEDLYEGLSSNFFAVLEGGKIIQTAPAEMTLSGSTQKLVLECCREANLDIQRKFPQLNEAIKWEGAFISSTSRLLLPIDHLILDDSKSQIDFQESKTIELLRSLFLSKLQQHSTPIL